jgi:transcriptional regulator with XRE-family HTH domain
MGRRIAFVMSVYPAKHARLEPIGDGREITRSSKFRNESGKNRLSAAILFEICEALEVSLSSIFERELKA